MNKKHEEYRRDIKKVIRAAEKKTPLRLRRIFDANDDCLTRLKITVGLLANLIKIACMVGFLIMLPFAVYTVIKAMVWYITRVV